MDRVEKPAKQGRLPRLVTGVGLGAALMYFLDPRQGRRRRSLLRDQVVSAWSKSSQAAETVWRDMRQRTEGALAELLATLRSRPLPDDLLTRRVRARMGRYVSHPSSIEVTAHEGHVTLSGVIVEGEDAKLISAVQGVRGVRSVSSALNVERSSTSTPTLQGEGRRRGESWDVMQRSWSPTTRTLVGATGCALMANCASRRTPGAILLGTVGFGLFLRAVTNLESQRLFGIGAGRRGIDLEKTITIQAPVDAVFSLLADMENYPRFTESVLSVRKIADDRYRETVRGPARTALTLEVVVTRAIPGEFLAWKSGPGSEVKFAGQSRFDATSEGGTRVHTRLSYNPPGGVLTHSAARLTGLDPQAFLEDLALRAKSYLETGRRPHDATEPMPAETQ